MMKIMLPFTVWLAVNPGRLMAADLCVRYACQSGGATCTKDSISATDAAAQCGSLYYPTSCSCAGYMHTPTAPEIGSAVATEVKQAIAQGMKDALIEIQKDSIEREKRIYERMAELQNAYEAQIKALRLILEAIRPQKSEQQPTGKPVSPPQPTKPK